MTCVKVEEGTVLVASLYYLWLMVLVQINLLIRVFRDQQSVRSLRTAKYFFVR